MAESPNEKRLQVHSNSRTSGDTDNIVLVIESFDRGRYCCGFDTSVSDLAGEKRGPEYDHEQEEQAGEDLERDVVDVLQRLLALHVGVVDVAVGVPAVHRPAGPPADALERVERGQGDRRRAPPGRRRILPAQ